MPLYDYENLTTGQRAEFFRPVARRDIPGWRRLMPDRLIVHGHGLAEQEPINFVRDAQRGFYLAEQSGGRAELERRMGMTTKQIKRVWNNFNETDQPAARPVPEAA